MRHPFALPRDRASAAAPACPDRRPLAVIAERPIPSRQRPPRHDPAKRRATWNRWDWRPCVVSARSFRTWTAALQPDRRRGIFARIPQSVAMRTIPLFFPARWAIALRVRRTRRGAGGSGVRCSNHWMSIGSYRRSQAAPPGGPPPAAADRAYLGAARSARHKTGLPVLPRFPRMESAFDKPDQAGSTEAGKAARLDRPAGDWPPVDPVPRHPGSPRRQAAPPSHRPMANRAWVMGQPGRRPGSRRSGCCCRGVCRGGWFAAVLAPAAQPDQGELAQPESATSTESDNPMIPRDWNISPAMRMQEITSRRGADNTGNGLPVQGKSSCRWARIGEPDRRVWAEWLSGKGDWLPDVVCRASTSYNV